MRTIVDPAWGYRSDKYAMHSADEGNMSEIEAKVFSRIHGHSPEGRVQNADACDRKERCERCMCREDRHIVSGQERRLQSARGYMC